MVRGAEPITPPARLLESCHDVLWGRYGKLWGVFPLPNLRPLPFLCVSMESYKRLWIATNGIDS